MGMFDFFSKKKHHQSSAVDYKEVINQLEVLGYFKYASPYDIPALKNEIIASLKDHWLSTIYNDQKPWNGKDSGIITWMEKTFSKRTALPINSQKWS